LERYSVIDIPVRGKLASLFLVEEVQEIMILFWNLGLPVRWDCGSASGRVARLEGREIEVFGRQEGQLATDRGIIFC